MIKNTWFLLPVLFLLHAACVGEQSQQGPFLEMEGGWARAMPLLSDGGGSGSNSAAYLVIRNTGGEDDRLVGAESPVAREAEVHESRMVDDVMRMRELGELPIPSRDSVLLVPGGIHIMLVDLTRPLLEGDSLELTLQFQKTGPVTLTLPVRLMGEG